jgi:hypothetical protein
MSKLVSVSASAVLDEDLVSASAAEIMGEGTSFQKCLRFVNGMVFNGEYKLAVILCEKMLTLDEEANLEKKEEEKA